MAFAELERRICEESVDRHVGGRVCRHSDAAVRLHQLSHAILLARSAGGDKSRASGRVLG